MFNTIIESAILEGNPLIKEAVKQERDFRDKTTEQLSLVYSKIHPLIEETNVAEIQKKVTGTIPD